MFNCFLGGIHRLEKNCFLRKRIINYGSIFENACAQELFYYNNKKNGEVDFVVTYKGKIVPIEIKSGKDYGRHSALTNLLSNKTYEIEEAFVFCNDNYHKKREYKLVSDLYDKFYE